MNLHQLYLTHNDCYKAGKTMTPKGIMVHSTGANNPDLRRYVGPDDGLLGKNKYNNHWNTATPGGRQVCVHAFIGKLMNGSIATYQTLPWNMVGWHSGSGSKGNANYMGYIGFEICEDGLSDPAYFSAVYKEAIELCVYLCKKYGLTEKNIICHCEGYKQGIASNHGDVMHWFPKHGKSMDIFRTDVKSGLAAGEPTKPSEPTVSTDTAIKVGSLVKITGSQYYGSQNIPSWVKAKNWYVREISGDRVVIDKSEDGKNAICSPVSASNLAVVGGKAPAYRVHTVVHGDTLWDIAKKYLGSGARYTEIVKLNGLKSNVIYSGQKLNILN